MAWTGLPDPVRRRLERAWPADLEYLAEVASQLSETGQQCYRDGQPAEAVGPTQGAVAIRRRLATLAPIRHEAPLATALSNLGVFLFALGEHQQALAATTEAVDSYRRVASRDDRYREDLASALNNQGNRLAAMGRLDQALTATQEAVRLRRDLAAARPDLHLGDLAGSLNNLGVRCNELGQTEEAVRWAKESVGIRRRQLDEHTTSTTIEAVAATDALRAELASALNNLGAAQASAGEKQMAIDATREAADLYRVLTRHRPQRHLLDLATTLSNLGSQEWEHQRPRPAEATAEQAVLLFEELAQDNPGVRGELATALNNLGVYRAANGKNTEALRAARSAVALSRQLAQANQGFREDLAIALNNLGTRLAENAKPGDALTCAEEAVALMEELHHAFPQRYHRDLIDCLTNLTNRLIEADCYGEAERRRSQAQRLRRDPA